MTAAEENKPDNEELATETRTEDAAGSGFTMAMKGAKKALKKSAIAEDEKAEAKPEAESPPREKRPEPGTELPAVLGSERACPDQTLYGIARRTWVRKAKAEEAEENEVPGHPATPQRPSGQGRGRHIGNH